MTAETSSAGALPAIIYGTAWKRAETARLVECAVLAGFTAVDTANQPKHYDETLVGEALLSLQKKGITRAQLFLQTKFTPLDGQDHRVPYDASASLREQVEQSLASSLSHLHTDYLDSYLLHGPYSSPRLGTEDWEVWRAMEDAFRAGKVLQIGISNVNALQLAKLAASASTKPHFVQNRVYASRGWDKDVRQICREHGIHYQGFSLLTANASVVQHPVVDEIARRSAATREQVIYRFAVELGIIPLSGTTKESHMREAAKACALELPPGDVQAIAGLS